MNTMNRRQKGRILIFTDGGSKGNPGPAAIGIVAYKDAEKPENELFRYREDIGRATNNEAEYTAVIRALELIKAKIKANELKKPEKILFHLDSELVVKQLNGEYKIKKPHIRDLIFKIRVRESELRIMTTYTHIPRTENKLADALVNDEA